MSISKEYADKKAELKTIADYALILQYCSGYEKEESGRLAMQSHGEPLFDELFERNKQLFTTGDVVIL